MAWAMARPMPQPMSAPSTREMAVARRQNLEEDNKRRQTERETDIGGQTDRQRLKNRCGIRDGDDKQASSERKPGH